MVGCRRRKGKKFQSATLRHKTCMPALPPWAILYVYICVSRVEPGYSGTRLGVNGRDVRDRSIQRAFGVGLLGDEVAGPKLIGRSVSVLKEERVLPLGQSIQIVLGKGEPERDRLQGLLVHCSHFKVKVVKGIDLEGLNFA